jgi:hypothetical protein
VVATRSRDVGGVGHVVERGGSDDGVDALGDLGLLERHPTVVLLVGRLGVDAHRFVAAGAKHRHEAAERAAANLDDLRWRSG